VGNAAPHSTFIGPICDSPAAHAGVYSTNRNRGSCWVGLGRVLSHNKSESSHSVHNLNPTGPCVSYDFGFDMNIR